MTIRIEHKNKIVEFYNVPGNVVKAIETLLNEIEANDSNIISAESEVVGSIKEDRNGYEYPCSKCPDNNVLMTCKRTCDRYYVWISRLKGERR